MWRRALCKQPGTQTHVAQASPFSECCAPQTTVKREVLGTSWPHHTASSAMPHSGMGCVHTACSRAVAAQGGHALASGPKSLPSPPPSTVEVPRPVTLPAAYTASTHQHHTTMHAPSAYCWRRSAILHPNECRTHILLLDSALRLPCSNSTLLTGMPDARTHALSPNPTRGTVHVRTRVTGGAALMRPAPVSLFLALRVAHLDAAAGKAGAGRQCAGAAGWGWGACTNNTCVVHSAAVTPGPAHTHTRPPSLPPADGAVYVSRGVEDAERRHHNPHTVDDDKVEPKVEELGARVAGDACACVAGWGMSMWSGAAERGVSGWAPAATTPALCPHCQPTQPPPDHPHVPSLPHLRAGRCQSRGRRRRAGRVRRAGWR